ncbi:FmdB family zinc ribbon protein [Teredinibacter turnerae]|uniref:Regulatory protein, FmdB family n=1 Tax=Teredinibacter turnerae (strain ATCC 39867 / T7901) TaxID=377629 RepID=C5BPP3_TERTT|nr:zinc ribbon domain-containing protein [Teredinibacter turnerae]ACR13125.1 regulatory protein, FmdB family [Teredinibacter turnerae T7901]
MPIYEYRCESCGHELEALQKISDAPLQDCPACETASLKKKVSAAAFRLKGGGWYETDFKSGKKKNLAGDDKAAKPASGGGDSTTKPKPADSTAKKA